MTAFDPKTIKAASKSQEFNGTATKTPRSILMAGIDAQVALWKAGPKAGGRRWFTVGNKEVALKLKFANKAIPLIGDEETVVVPVEQLEAAYAYYRGEVERGAFDKFLAVLAAGREQRVEKMRKTRAEKKAAKEAAPAKVEEPAKEETPAKA